VEFCARFVCPDTSRLSLTRGYSLKFAANSLAEAKARCDQFEKDNFRDFKLNSLVEVKKYIGRFLTKNQLPPIGNTVMVSGGPASWNGRTWISCINGRAIQWDVLWWKFIR
jgi:hypothetical protein